MNPIFGCARAPRIAAQNWTCSVCLHQTKPARSPRISQFSQLHSKPPKRSPNLARLNGKARTGRIRPGRIVLYASGGAAAGTSLLAFTEEIKGGYEAAERTGRVVAALGVCINDYRSTLSTGEGMDDAEEQQKELKACHQRCADRTLKVMQKNGGIFIKLGQHLSAMNYLLPIEWTKTFIPLQDQCPVSPFDSIEKMYKDDTGEEILEYFSAFEPEPIGAASLAQVHMATIRETGAKVAVKVQHPDLEQWAPLDLALTRHTFGTLKKFFPEYDLEWLSAEMEVSLPKELDFEEEARNAMRMKKYFGEKVPDLPLVIPDVVWAKKRILVMACESGCRPDDLEYLDKNHIDRDEVSATLARIFNEMIFGDGAPLHCDPHGGNIAIRKNESRSSLGRGPNFDVIIYDHGLYRDIELPLRRSYAKMWLAVIDGDMDRMKKYAKEVANIEEEDFPLFASAITGRDYSIVSREGSIMKTRTKDEEKTMSGALQEGLIVDLVKMLSRVPSIILLILKTNDLTRSLDENLQTRQGPIRSFMILARYCTRTVFHEQLEAIRNRGSPFWPPNTFRVVAAWVSYMRVEAKLEAFEWWLEIKRLLGYGRPNVEAGAALYG